MGKSVDCKVKVDYLVMPEFDFYADGGPAYAIAEVVKGRGLYSRSFQARIPVGRAREFGLDKVAVSNAKVLGEKEILIHGEWKVENFRDEDGEFRKFFYVLVS
jgi:hypothetical protein